MHIVVFRIIKKVSVELYKNFFDPSFRCTGYCSTAQRQAAMADGAGSHMAVPADGRDAAVPGYRRQRHQL